MADILHELKIKAPADRVYRALVDKEGLSGWWMPGVVTQSKVGSIVEIPFPGYRGEAEDRPPGAGKERHLVDG